MIERLYSLREASATLGMCRKQLRRRLKADLGLTFRHVRRGEKQLIRESQLEALLRIICPRQEERRIPPQRVPQRKAS